MKTFDQVVSESTCLKRVTVCELYAADGTLLARESNRCNPPNGVCQRMAVSNGHADYPDQCDCKWTHAEMVALLACKGKPARAVIYGHDFACPGCELALKTVGASIEVIPYRNGAGLKIAGSAPPTHAAQSDSPEAAANSARKEL